MPAKKQCPPYAVVYDESKKNIKLIHWGTYEKKYLPVFLEDREKFVKTVKKPIFIAKPPVISANEPEIVVKVPTETPVENPVEVPVEVLVEVPVEVPVDIPAESPVVVPMEIPSESPDEVPVEIPMANPAEILKESIPPGPHTTIFDPESASVKLITWDEYLEKYQQVDLAQWEKKSIVAPAKEIVLPTEVAKIMEPVEGQVAIYDESTESIKLISWDSYERDYLPTFLAVRKERELSRFQAHKKKQQKQEVQIEKIVEERARAYVAVYDEEKQHVCLQNFETYTPTYKQDYALIYNPKSQYIDLIFWSDYVKNHESHFRSQWNKAIVASTPAKSEESQGESTADLVIPEPSPIDNLTTVYDPITEGIKLVKWEDYLEDNNPPKQDWTTEYDEKDQSVRLTFWKPYEPSQSCIHTNPSANKPVAESCNVLAIPSTSPVTELTTVYDPVSEEIKLVSWEEYLKENTLPQQDWTTEYDEGTQSVRLAFWKPYKEIFKGTQSTSSPKPPSNDVIEGSTFTVQAPIADMTTVYDPITEEIKLVSWDEYVQENQLPKQDWTTAYDEKTQSVKLVFWSEYVNPQEEKQQVQVQETPVKSTQLTTELTTVYNEVTQSIDLIPYEEYLKHNSVPKQDYAAVYDEPNQSVKLVFWKDYQDGLKMC